MIISFKDRKNTDFTKEDVQACITSDRYKFNGIELARLDLSGCHVCCFSNDGYNCDRSEWRNFNIRDCRLSQFIRIDDLDFSSDAKIVTYRQIPDVLPINTVTFDGKYKTVKETFGCRGCIFHDLSGCMTSERKLYALECRASDSLIFVKNDSKTTEVVEDVREPLVTKRRDGTAIIDFRDGKVIESKLDRDSEGCSGCWFNNYCESICSKIGDIKEIDCYGPDVTWIPVCGFPEYRSDWKKTETGEEKDTPIMDKDDVDDNFDNSELIGDELEMNNGGTVIIERDHGGCDGCYFNNGPCKRDSLLIDPPDDCDNIIFKLGEEPDPDIGTRVVFNNGDSALCSYSDDGCTGCCFDNGGCSDEIDCSDVKCHQRRYSEYETAEVTAKVKASNKMPEHGVVFADSRTFSERYGYKAEKVLTETYPAPLIFKKEKKFSI